MGLLENGRRCPTEYFARRVDELLGARGLLVALAELAREQPWTREVGELERCARSMCYWAPITVPGLLQTREYARAVLATTGCDSTRMAATIEELSRRQQLLHMAGPTLWVVMDASVLERAYGSQEVLHDQLKAVYEFAAAGRITVQLLPTQYSRRVPPAGPFTLLSFPDSADIAWLEGPGQDHLLDCADQVAACRHRYDLIRAAALPPHESLQLLTQAMDTVTCHFA